jgi:hypothetical protein
MPRSRSAANQQSHQAKENVLRRLTDLPGETRSRIRGLIQVRDAVRSCLRSQLDGSGEPEQNGFVVNSPLGWKATTYRRYRCEPHWRTLIGWLESNGIDARKKVH